MLSAEEFSIIKLPIPPFKIGGNQYITPKFCRSGVSFSLCLSKIDSLDSIVVHGEELRFALQFPFNSGRTYTIKSSSKYFTVQNLIDEIRRSYRHLFRHSSEMAIGWERSLSSSGLIDLKVSYPFSGIFVSEIWINPVTLELTIKPECFPIIDDAIHLPF